MVEDTMSSDNQPAGRVGLEEQSSLAHHAGDAAEMTAQSTAGVEVGTSSRPATSSSTAEKGSPPPSRGGSSSGTGASQRNASSKFASLRAAFEKTGASTNGSHDSGARKRVVTGSELNVGKNRERNQEHEAELAKLRDELEKERELRVAYEDKVTSLEAEMEEASNNILQRSEELAGAMEEITQLKRLESARAGDETSDAGEEEGANQNHVQDSAALRRQLSDLKRSISRSTRPTGQLSDTTLRQEVGLMQHEIQNWVVNNFRRAKTNASPEELCEKLNRIAEPEQIERLRPLYEVSDSAAKLAIYQATVAVYVMEIFSDRFLFGLRGQYDWAKRTRQATETLPAVLDTATYNRWRAMTFSLLTQSMAIKEPVESAAGGMSEMICITLNAMTDMEGSEARLSSLKTIVGKAISLAHRVRSQQAQYEFSLPEPNQTFDAASMEDVIDDGETEDERLIRCATFPTLLKSADDAGASLDPKKVVFRAKVLCKEAEDS